MQQDKRMKLVNDALSGIRIVKAYAWEAAMGKRIGEVRRQELELVRDNQVASAMMTAVFFLVPKFIPAGVFVMFHLTGGNFSFPIIFITLALGTGFNACLLMLPGALNGITQMQAAVGRLENFLKMAERSSDTDENSLKLPYSSTEPAVSMSNCTFQWSSETLALENIDLAVQPGELLMIIGKVGSGKSALLNAILGELDRTVGKLETRGSLSYACQEPWLFEGTLQQNVVFTKGSFDQARYKKVIEACALESDIKQFPGGDQVEIGARGVVLSGGQKARVGLARAVYHNADIIAMDDPLAAVDVMWELICSLRYCRASLQERPVSWSRTRLSTLPRLTGCCFLTRAKFLQLAPMKSFSTSTATTSLRSRPKTRLWSRGRRKTRLRVKPRNSALPRPWNSPQRSAMMRSRGTSIT
jgi:ABC-type bacteriocin/lantibiotic exporter with double-glycine peptidase domain